MPSGPELAADGSGGETSVRRSITSAGWRNRRRRAAQLLIESALGELVCAPGRAGLQVDVDEFRSCADRARRSGDLDAYAEAIGLHRDGLLPDDRYEEWAIGPRDELRLEYLALLEEQAALLESRGDRRGRDPCGKPA